MKQQRELDKNLLVLDSGDLLFRKYTGPLHENEASALTQKARLLVETLTLMGYDAIGVGDDDLTLGKEFLMEISKKSGVPILSSNLVDEESGKPILQTHLLKEINGLKIGIFSLLSPEILLGPTDPRRKGITLRPPVEAAQNMIKELQPKTDLIILLSHLGYPKDMELAQALSGIHIIVGSHTGMNLTYPPIVKNTIILQSGSKGMYASKFEMTFHGNDLGFYNTTNKKSLENNLTTLKNRLSTPATPEAQKTQLRKTIEDVEKRLAEIKGKNEFNNTIFPLTEQMKENPDILKIVEAYKSKFPEAPPPPPVAPPPPAPKSGTAPPKK